MIGFDEGPLGEHGRWDHLHEMRRSCRCRPHFLRELRGITSDSSAPDPIGSRRLRSPFSQSYEAHSRKLPAARFALCAVRHRAPHIRPGQVAKRVLIVMGPILLLGILLIALGTITKDRWGINTKPVNCPACGFPTPRGVRQPKSLGQALWGGWTCEKCGCEMDKWGRVITLMR